MAASSARVAGARETCRCDCASANETCAAFANDIIGDARPRCGCENVLSRYCRKKYGVRCCCCYYYTLRAWRRAESERERTVGRRERVGDFIDCVKPKTRILDRNVGRRARGYEQKVVGNDRRERSHIIAITTVLFSWNRGVIGYYFKLHFICPCDTRQFSSGNE